LRAFFFAHFVFLYYMPPRPGGGFPLPRYASSGYWIFL
jgi:hypothetical protein